MQGLREYCDSCVSITSDLGVEVGVADFQCRPDSMLPGYLADARMEVDGDGGDMVGGLPDFLFSSCLTIAGMLHICSNASKDVYRVVSYWSSLYESLKVIEALVTNKERVRKLVSH